MRTACWRSPSSATRQEPSWRSRLARHRRVRAVGWRVDLIKLIHQASQVPCPDCGPGAVALALITAGRHDEAAGTALEASTSGRLVPPNYWRAREIIRAVAERGPPEAADLTEAYRETCRDAARPALP